MSLPKPAQPSLTLNNGTKMPVLGLGTYTDQPNEAEEFVYNAIKIGYRHIDTADIYQNETQVGAGIKRAIADGLITRTELFVVTKLWSTRHKDAEAALAESLQRLGLDYVDLYLVHWPVAWTADNQLDSSITLEDVWRKMESFVEKGLARSIGVSNYNIQEIKDLVAYAKIQPVVNQVEIHPYFNNFKLQQVCHENKIFLTAYSPLLPVSNDYNYIAWDNLAADPVVNEIAQKHQKSPQQILLRWNIDVGNSVITKSSKEERLKQTFAILDFALGADDLAALNALCRGKRYRNPHDMRLPAIGFFFDDAIESYPGTQQ